MLRQTRPSSPTDKPVRGRGISTFLSSVAVLLSAIALSMTGFVLIQNFQLQQSFNQLSASLQKSPASSERSPTPHPNSVPQSSAADRTNTIALSQPTQPINAEIQPGQFIKPAFGGKAEVELLAVKRIQDPETGQGNVVNVQMRIRALQDMGESSVIVLKNAKARQPETNETYESYDVLAERVDRERAKTEGTEATPPRKERSNGGILLLQLEPGSSVDGYVWMFIPEGIDNIDLFIPETEAFINVPIARSQS